ncbi:hypothetical protein H1R20_g3359, partial [Candolleomyces eurysporus]
MTDVQGGGNEPSSKESTIKEKSVEKSEVNVVEEAQVAVTNADDDFPDGGLRAWLIVVGAVCNAFAASGYVNSWGAFQAYYQSSVLSHLPPSNMYAPDNDPTYVSSMY